MQESWAEAEYRCNFFLIAYRMPHALQRFFILVIHRYVAEDGKIITNAEPQNMGPQNVSKVRAVHSGHVFLVGIELDAACFEKRHFRRQASGSFILGGELARFDFAGLDVRLIKRVDSDN